MSFVDDQTLQDPEFIAALRLALSSGIGPAKVQALQACFGSLSAALSATSGQLQAVQGIGPKVAKTIVAASQLDVQRELDHCRDFGIQILTRSCDGFPELLREIADPPTLLFVKGEILPCDELAVAIVGTRHATHYGKKQAERFGYELAKAGFTIASGLARGIDAAAHRGALKAKGRTIAFLGGGVSKIYPPEHEDLAAEVTESGAIVSESAPLVSPIAGAFPQRNRLITGMSLGVVIVEAAARSGALISARMAMEQNREVFALPGQIDNPVARGVNSLIRDGATLVQSVDDVIEQLGPLRKPLQVSEEKTVLQPAELKLNDQEQQVLQHIDLAPMSLDALVARSKLPVHRILSTLSILEMKRLIVRTNGTTVQRTA
ncbi:DNA-protecting protein DprA [Blastopirellula marina]|uniref:DNA-protecting protein DprA n=1 Tax=Blastopirellula marina TaxID=124 RepID=A0A2S8F0U6_9BACT|nr:MULTISPECIES: DNA-processing protein DprA [Pirellulaceae]PQO25786.1 DNA-protecting protein DprA [Blastopirellula marina]RCS43469.1 DNA-protecting protein DprA [Bremerella cremea]